MFQCEFSCLDSSFWCENQNRRKIAVFRTMCKEASALGMKLRRLRIIADFCHDHSVKAITKRAHDGSGSRLALGCDDGAPLGHN